MMNRRITITILLAVVLLAKSFAQDIMITTQAEADAFNPSTTSISGNLVIDEDGTDPIVDLSNFSNLISIDGYLNIANNQSIVTVDGFSNLRTIGGYLRLNFNNALINLDGFSRLESVGTQLQVVNNNILASCCGIQNLLSSPQGVGTSVSIAFNDTGCDSETEIINSICNNIYVDEMATGNNDGSSWLDAFTDLQNALPLGINNTIHVAQGVYKPTVTTQRTTSFQISYNTTLLGGYATGGGVRDPDLYPTVLSGEIDNVPGFAGNSYHVVKVVGMDNVVIDGFQIRDGNADADPVNYFSRSRGGGVFCTGSDLTLYQTIVTNNKAIYGGGLYGTASSNISISYAEFRENEAEYGSALYHSFATNMYLFSTKIIDNESSFRCAIEVNNSLYTEIDNCLIANNEATNANAIAFIATNRDQSCVIRSSTILGGMNNKNLMTFQIGNGDELDLSIYNSIIAHQNPNFTRNVKAFNNGVFNFNHSNCYFQGTTVIGTGTNTYFSDIDGALVLNPDYSTSNCAPIANGGDNSYSINGNDINLNARVYEGNVDIGAYEKQEDCIIPRELFQEEINSTMINIYPNPVENILYLETALETFQVVITDVCGKKIMDKNDIVEIDLTALPQGTYIISIFQNGYLTKTDKFVKL